MSSQCSSPMTRATTPPSSPPFEAEASNEAGDTVEDEESEQGDEDTEARMRTLTSLLEKSSAYVSMLKQQMDKVKLTRRPPNPAPSQPEANPTAASDCRTHKRTRDDAVSDAEQPSKRVKLEGDASGGAHGQEQNDAHAFVQPVLVTGATLKDYQLEGVAWMAGLYQNGISGILADEMGLGKTLQTIAFHAWLRERSPAPFMVVCPLSVLNNWVEEFTRFAPDIPVCMYHGTPEERAELRRTNMVFSEKDMEYQTKSFESRGLAGPSATPGSRNKRGEAAKGGRGRKSKASAPSRRPKEVKSSTASRVSGRLSGRRKVDMKEPESDDEQRPVVKGKGKARGRRSTGGRAKRQIIDDSEEDEDASEDERAQPTDINVAPVGGPSEPELPPHQKTNFPVVITTYEMIIKDRPYLSGYFFGFIVVDEGHRLKNMDCKLMREIKSLNSAARMVLTGTPLHNNLAELWALLNFILPDIFDDVEAFEDWFDLPALQSTLSASRSSQLIHSLHAVLRPFLLRRLKVDVEADLPPKKEYVLYAPLSEQQHEVYDAVVGGHLRELLMKQAGDRGRKKAVNASSDEEEDMPLKLQAGPKGKSVRVQRAKRKSYALDGDDDEYFAKLESGEMEAERQKQREKSAQEQGREWQRKATLKKINNMKLQNPVMQLRKVCSHPFLFDWPVDPDTHEPVLNEDLVSSSGKMMMLDRLLDELFRRKHKVLLFSQFKTMLDIIEDWAVHFKQWPICRIDGSTSMSERRDEVSRFQNSGDVKDAPKLFLLSTRAAGLGLNLVAADTVIFYDQDWNPQMDLQAQDRAHRIGQTKPVLIFRLVSAHTVETKIMQRATEKRKLEALVIAKGQFRTPTMAVGRTKPETMAEMAAALLKLEGEQIQVVSNTAAGKASVISNEELDMLLDRRPEVFADRGKGWTSAEREKAKEGESIPGARKPAFAVYEAPVDEAGDMLAGLLDGDSDEE
ncbi:SNF2 family N-terminal domain-containing protein [Amylocystis lapponica]|nr:SNF2 family N-terminal domain-containing protein [Amylocystis lapponica]